MRYSKAILFGLIPAIMGLSSCLKPKVKSINPEFAVPIASGRLNVADLLAADTSELVTVDGDGLMALTYEGGVFKLKGSEFIKIPNTQSAVGINSPLVLLAANFQEGETANFSGSQTQSFNLENLEINRMDASAGLFRIIVTSSFSNDVTVNFNVPSVKKNNQELDVSVTVPSNTANRESRVKLVSLADYSFIFGPNNELGFNYDVTITSRGNDVLVTDSLIISFAFENVEFKRLEFTPDEISFDVPRDSIDLKLFKNSSTFAEILDFGFFDPTVSLTFENGFGIAAELEVEEFKAGGPDPANDESITGLPQFISIARPANVGEVATTNFEVNKSNSNIDKVLGPDDQFLKYNFAVKTTQSGVPAVITDKSTFGVRALLNLPLMGHSKGWSVSDTLDIDFSAIDPELIESGSIRLNLKNQFPFEADLQMYLLNGRNEIIDSLVKGDITIIPSGTIDPNNGRSTIAESKRDFVLDSKLIKNLQLSKSFLMKATIRTADSDLNPPAEVAIYQDYFMEISVGVRAKLGDNAFNQ